MRDRNCVRQSDTPERLGNGNVNLEVEKMIVKLAVSFWLEASKAILYNLKVTLCQLF
jgi:hypothetical protein